MAHAPAKINLYLHVTGKTADSYHTLDSLVAFADIGDELTLTPSGHFTFEITGPYADKFSTQEKSTERDSGNLVIRAIWRMADIAGKTPDFHIGLTKNLPLAAGIGGGSSDAATITKLLSEHWNLQWSEQERSAFLESMGSDVPACFHGHPGRMQGKGEIWSPVSLPGNIPLLLINANIACPTAQVFKNYKPAFKHDLNLPDQFTDLPSLIGFLQETGNDLTQSAVETVPEIAAMLNMISAQDGCRLARLSGSGATGFGLFENKASAEAAANIIMKNHPEWWVKTGLLNPA